MKQVKIKIETETCLWVSFSLQVCGWDCHL